MSKMLWGGRFSSGPAGSLLEFTSSENIVLDARLVPYDIWGNRAHALMLLRQKILTEEEAAEILRALSEVSTRHAAGTFRLQKEMEDVHLNIETAVTSITPSGKKLHTARSRNDQVSTDTRLYMRDMAMAAISSALSLQDALFAISQKNIPFPSYTHTQVAQPITLSFFAQSHYNCLSRDIGRLFDFLERSNTNPLGSGAVAGTTWNIDRNYTASLLGFDSVQENPMDAVGSRGELEAEFIFCLSQLMAHLSRISEDMIFLSSKGMAELSDEYSTGSSMMPQKKNPDPLELVRGRTSRLIGLCAMSLSLQKGLPSGYNLDSQESKFALMQASDTAIACTDMVRDVLLGIKFNREAIVAELEKGYACATEAADLLASSGVPFREAHGKVGKLVRECIAQKRHLSAVSGGEASLLWGVKISPAKWAEAVNPDKTSRMHNLILPNGNSVWKNRLASMQKKIADAKKLTDSEEAKILGKKKAGVSKKKGKSKK